MSSHDDWHGRGKGLARGQFNERADKDKAQDRLLDQMKQRARDTASRGADQKSPKPLHPTLTPNNKGLRRRAEIDAQADREAAQKHMQKLLSAAKQHSQSKDQGR